MSLAAPEIFGLAGILLALVLGWVWFARGDSAEAPVVRTRADILKQIRQIEVRANRLVTESLAGQYHSAFKGQGMDFDEVREYQPGDDVRQIDWNVTARMNIPFIKKFVEERELTVLLAVDLSKSGSFGSVDDSKRDLAAKVASAIAFSAIRNNDKVGLLLFTETVEKFIPPRKGRRHILRVIDEILEFHPENRGTHITDAMKFLNRIATRKAIVVVFSDFMEMRQPVRFGRGLVSQPMSVSDPLSRDTLTALRQVNRRHDLVAVQIVDRYELELPALGRMVLKDSETGEVLEVDTGDREVRESFKEEQVLMQGALKKQMRSLGIDTIHVRTDEEYTLALTRFFENREKRARHS
ncbi:MAG: DUF58 domain-containing protein [Verrucomicrobiales bacterium]|nr:DUF58 domain-containing protein [Verrucomicrobiales bacterium]|tara:strand:+ start:1729 stop:2790 length:1062 start_codon:yes stop_codon:yes gene_type:complete